MKAMIAGLFLMLGTSAAFAAVDIIDSGLNCLDSKRADQISECTKVIQSSQLAPPSLSQMYQSRGAAYEDKGQRALALADYREAIRLDSKNLLADSGLRRLAAAPH
jgi:tetratricopeptide (TPR) repeat protein